MLWQGRIIEIQETEETMDKNVMLQEAHFVYIPSIEIQEKITNEKESRGTSALIDTIGMICMREAASNCGEKITFASIKLR